MTIIFPKSGQPLHALLAELAAVGGVRGQNLELAPSGGRWGYQVTDEVSDAWDAAQGVTGKHAKAKPKAVAAEDSAPATETADSGETAEDSPADEGAEETPAKKPRRTAGEKKTTTQRKG